MITTSVFRKLALLGATAMALATSGCIVDNPSGCAPGAVDVAWSVSANGAVISCAQAGASEVDIYVDGTTFQFNCNDHEDVISVAGGVNHTVSATLFDSSGNNLSSVSSMTVFVPCNTTYAFPAIDFSITP
jgi:hypothetical protein